MGKVATKQQQVPLTEAVTAVLATKQSAVTATVRAKGVKETINLRQQRKDQPVETKQQ